MIEKKEIYKCSICGNIIESLWNGKPDISCCGISMTKLVANTVDAAKEKHVPVIERSGTTVTVKIGEIAHPMQSDHYILFVELLAGTKVYRHDFKETDGVAQAVFTVAESEGPLSAREYCNKHGLWSVA